MLNVPEAFPMSAGATAVITTLCVGGTAIATFLTQSARYRGNRRTVLIPTRANGQPAFGRYVPDEYAQIFHLHGIVVLTMEGDRISAITNFIDSGLLPHFGLPRTLPG
jgi:hypothetical protein